MARVKVTIHKSSTGLPLAELPFEPSWSFQLSGAGSLTGELPIWHPYATEDILGQHHDDPDRELCVWVDGQCDWSGPLVGTSASLSGGTIQISGREVPWYLGKRTIEGDTLDFGGVDRADAVDALLTYATTKEATGDDGLTLGDDIKSEIPRFSWDVSAIAGVNLPASSGTNLVGFAGDKGHTILEALEALANDPETGFDFRMDYRTSTIRTQPHRTMVFSPNFGATPLGRELTERILIDYGRDMDNERAATRVTVMYAGGKVVRQNVTAVGNNVILTEVVDDFSDTSDEDLAIGRAKDLRRLSKPMVRVPSASFRHGAPLPHDAINLGDVAPFGVTWPDILSITADTRRVVEIQKTVSDGALDVALTFNDRLDDLGGV